MPTMIFIISLVVIVGACIALLTDKTRFFCSMLGYFLIALHMLVLFHDSNTGRQVKFFANVSTPSAFFYELFGFIGYNLILIIGIILVIVARKEKRKHVETNKETMEEDEDEDEEDENKE